MGNQKLRLSNIIPNVWFNKLKEMTTNSNNISSSSSSKIIRKPHHTTKGTTNLEPCTPPPSLPRKSYHFTRNLNSKSSSARKTRPTTKSPSSVSTACSCATATAHSVQSKPASTTTTTTCSSLDNLSLPPELHCFDRMVAWSSTSCNGSSTSPLPDDDDHIHSDVVIGVDKMSLAPIITEHKKFSDLVREIGAAEEEQTDTDDKPKVQRRGPVRNISTSSGSPRVRIRINSPRLSKRVESNAAGRNRRRKSVKWSSSESVAVLKSSADPERDFRESMVEMIVENQIRAAKDLEDLLASYLSLNSAEYHRLIIQVFQQIWFGLNQIH